MVEIAATIAATGVWYGHDRRRRDGHDPLVFDFGATHGPLRRERAVRCPSYDRTPPFWYKRPT